MTALLQPRRVRLDSEREIFPRAFVCAHLLLLISVGVKERSRTFEQMLLAYKWPLAGVRSCYFTSCAGAREILYNLRP